MLGVQPRLRKVQAAEAEGRDVPLVRCARSGGSRLLHELRPQAGIIAGIRRQSKQWGRNLKKHFESCATTFER